MQRPPRTRRIRNACGKPCSTGYSFPGEFRRGKRKGLRNCFLQESRLPVFFEFTDYYFEHNAEAFQKMARVYFQGVTFSEILPGIAYLLLRSPEYKDGARLKEQLEKLLKALKRRQECLVVVGKMVCSLWRSFCPS